MSPERKKVYQLEIPVNLDIEMVVRRLQLRGKSSQRLEEMARELAAKAVNIARPKAIYQISRVRVIDNTTVDIDGVLFTSRLLSKLLCDQDKVIPFIATIGKELDELPVPPGSMLYQFSLDAIKTVVLVGAVDYLTEYVKKRHDIPKAALMNPGELQDWPITQQKQLFDLFGGAEKRIGVSLTAGGAMRPIKSRSGILFANETGFLSCQLCTQFECPGRRAEYDPALVKEYLGTPQETS
jgi:hypothetical protein